MAPIERITLFKIPNDADRDRVLEQYKVLAKTAVKVYSLLSFPFFFFFLLLSSFTFHSFYACMYICKQ